MIFSVVNNQGYISGTPSVRVYDIKGRLKILPGGPIVPGGTIWGAITGLITNQTDLITYLSSNYVPVTRNITINGVTQNLSADRTWTIPAGGTVTSVQLAAGVGISLSGTNPITTSGTITVTNSAPDQTVVLSSGTGINTSGTYPNFTITNTAPDQTVVLNAGTGISTSGTYPNFTITNTDPASGVSLTSAGGTESLVNDGTGPSLATKGLTAGTGISLSSTATAVTITNSSPDQTVTLTAGTGVVITGTYPNFTITGTPAIALQTPYVFGTHAVNQSIGAGTTLYWTDRITGNGSAVLVNRQCSISFAGTGDHLQFRTSTPQPLSGSLTVTVQKNGVDTVLTRTVASGSLAGVFEDLINSFTFVDNDLISIKAVNTATSAAAGLYEMQFNAYKT